MFENVKVGTILENSIRQFAKVISSKNGMYGLSHWGTREQAMKSTVAFKFLNVYGLQSGNVRIVKADRIKTYPSVGNSASTTGATTSSKPKGKGTVKSKTSIAK